MTRHDERGLKDNVAKLRRLTNLLQCGLSDECCWCLGGDAIDFLFLRQSHRLPPSLQQQFQLIFMCNTLTNPNPLIYRKRGIYPFAFRY